ncbi:MAG: AhpC/TSA family protein, partial [Actinomycetota bacterium]
MKHRLESPFAFLGDEERAAYRALDLGRAGLLRTYLHPQVLRPYLGFALHGRFPRLRAQQDRRQLGGDFVLGRDGNVVFSHAERGPEDRAPVGKIVRAALSIS